MDNPNGNTYERDSFAYNCGWLAYRRGNPIENNPFESYTQQAWDWEDGWNDSLNNKP